MMWRTSNTSPSVSHDGFGGLDFFGEFSLLEERYIVHVVLKLRTWRRLN